MSNTANHIDLINELQWRGLLKDCTDEQGLRAHLADPANAPRKIYAGFDPTADSLTIGNLVPIMLLAHVKRAGHTPVVVMGGGTGLIGDPSGKSAERQLNTPETINTYIDGQRPIYSAILGQEGKDFLLKNNYDWLKDISYIEALRDIGKHFSVNMMMRAESVKARLEEREHGISYTEFSYMLLQAYDFAHLYEHEGVTVQFGGSDQYGNIVAGTGLNRRMQLLKYGQAHSKYFDACFQYAVSKGHSFEERADILNSVFIELGVDAQRESCSRIPQREDAQECLMKIKQYEQHFREVAPEIRAAIDSLKHSAAAFIDGSHLFGLTNPLVEKADGTKFGKTETGAIWLTANRTSPYAYYQFWLNATDDDAKNWIKIFTFLPQEEIESLIARHAENPGKRELQRTLAQEATTILHGDEAMQNAQAAGKALFSGDITTLDKHTMLEVFASVPTTDHSKADLADGIDMVALLKETNLATSNREAREFLNEGSVSINGTKIDTEFKLTANNLLHDSFIAIRRGKKKWHLTKWS